MIDPDERPFGMILAGGRARRMGGGDKPLLRLRGRTLLALVIERIEPHCVALAINAHGDPSRWSAYPYPVVPDPVPGHAGPLAGVLAGLLHIERTREAAWLLTVPGDTPFLPTDLVSRLTIARRVEAATLACASSGGRIHPVVALWPIGIRARLEDAVLRRGVRSVTAFQADLATAVVSWSIETSDPFLNLNTPAELAAAGGQVQG